MTELAAQAPPYKVPARLGNLAFAVRTYPYQDHFEPFTRIHELAKFSIISEELIYKCCQLVLAVDRTPNTEITLPADIDKLTDEITNILIKFFELGEFTHSLEIKDIRPSTLPEDLELGGK